MQQPGVFTNFVGREKTIAGVEKYVNLKIECALEGNFRLRPKYCGLAGGSGTGKSRALMELVEKVQNTILSYYPLNKEDVITIPLIITFNSAMGLTEADKKDNDDTKGIETSKNIYFYVAIRLILS